MSTVFYNDTLPQGASLDKPALLQQLQVLQQREIYSDVRWERDINTFNLTQKLVHFKIQKHGISDDVLSLRSKLLVIIAADNRHKSTESFC